MGGMPAVVSSALLEAADGGTGALAHRIGTWLRGFELRYEPGDLGAIRQNLPLDARRVWALLRHVWGNTAMRQTMLVLMDVAVGFGVLNTRRLLQAADDSSDADRLDLMVRGLVFLFGAAVILAMSEMRGHVAGQAMRIEGVDEKTDPLPDSLAFVSAIVEDFGNSVRMFIPGCSVASQADTAVAPPRAASVIVKPAAVSVLLKGRMLSVGGRHIELSLFEAELLEQAWKDRRRTARGPRLASMRST
jgi:hypothetical protein